jgi:hypothetical protein
MHEGPARNEPFVVMSPRGTRLLGVAGLCIGLGLGLWVWTSDLPLWWKTLMSLFAVPLVGVGLQYTVLGRYPILLLDHVGVTYRPFEDPVTLLRRGPIVRLGWQEISSIGSERSRLGLRWLTIRSRRTHPRPRWLRALGAGERAPYIRLSLSVLRVSEDRLVDEMRSRALPHAFADERKGLTR